MLLLLLGPEGEELVKVGIVNLLLINLLHVEIYLAEELRGLEFFALLDANSTSLADQLLHEGTSRLAAYLAGRHVGDHRRWDQTLHVLVQVDGRAVAVDGDALPQLHDLAEDVVREPLQRFLGADGPVHDIARGRNDLIHAHFAVVALQLRQFRETRGHADLVAAGRAD